MIFNVCPDFDAIMKKENYTKLLILWTTLKKFNIAESNMYTKTMILRKSKPRYMSLGFGRHAAPLLWVLLASLGTSQAK